MNNYTDVQITIRRNSILTAILGTIVGLMLVGSLRAQGDDQRATLLEIASQKRHAIIFSGDPERGSVGFFVSQDGLAIFLTSAFGDKKHPSFFLTDGAKMDAPTIRHIDADLGLVFVKFAHKPKVWLEPRKKPVPLKDEAIGIICLRGKPDAVIGPIWARVSIASRNDLHPKFRSVVSIAAGLPFGEMNIGTGCPVIDSKGKLCGILYTLVRSNGSQTLITAMPSDLWLSGIAKAQVAKKEIPLPLPPGSDPKDPAQKHLGYTLAVKAMISGRHEEGIKHVQAALKNHPDSPLLKKLYLDLASVAGGADCEALIKAIKPPPGASAAAQMSYFGSLARMHRTAGNHNKAAQAYLEAIRLSPKNHSSPRYNYSLLLEQQEKWDEALVYARDAVAGSAGSFLDYYRLKRLLGKAHKWEEAAKVTEQIILLEKLYRRTQ